MNGKAPTGEEDQLLLYARDLGQEYRQLRGARVALEEREARIRDLAAAYVKAQEDERRRIAYEVHDRLAQGLVVALHRLQEEPWSSADPARRQHVDGMSALIREALQQTRDVIHDLHPPFLEEVGLCPLIEEELGRLQEATGCLTRFEADYRVRAPREAEVALYRISQEALTNIRRHALGVRHVVVNVSGRAQLVRLRVCDDGCGFDVRLATKQARAGGLMSMEFRAVSLEGTLQVTRARGGGTVLTACIPTQRRRPSVRG